MWQLLHWLVSVYEFCLWLRLRLIAFALWSYDLCRTPAEREQNEYDFLQQCKQHLNKIPKHLNVIIGPGNQQVDGELLTRIFCYALHMNINCISYYDTRYMNTTNSSSQTQKIVLEKLKCPKGWKSKTSDSHYSIWYKSKDDCTNGSSTLNGCTTTTSIFNKTESISSSSSTKSTLTNGHSLPSSYFLEEKTLEIYEIQPENNRPLLAQVCHELFQQRHTAEMKEILEQRDLLTERLNQELAHHLRNLSEPELSIIFYENMCTFGMLPWHTRFTEFHRHATGQRFDVKTFAHILYKYSRCEQRWGK